MSGTVVDTPAGSKFDFLIFLPVIGAFLGGVLLPTIGFFSGIGVENSVGGLALGCAIGAGIGDVILHLAYRNFGKSSIMGVVMNALYAGGFAFGAGYLLKFLAQGTTLGITTGQYIVSAISALGVYLMGRYTMY